MKKAFLSFLITMIVLSLTHAKDSSNEDNGSFEEKGNHNFLSSTIHLKPSGLFVAHPRLTSDIQLSTHTYREVSFDQYNNGRYLSPDEDYANRELSYYLGEAQYSCLIIYELLSREKSPNWPLIYNCGKALRHITKAEGGNPYRQWRSSSSRYTLYDLDLLNLSHSLLLYGLIYSSYKEKKDWWYQLNQTDLHLRQTSRAITQWHDSEGHRQESNGNLH